MENLNVPIDMSKLAISAIAKPMASEKLTMKLIGLISKLSKVKLIKRGVKVVNKFYRKEESQKKKMYMCISRRCFTY